MKKIGYFENSGFLAITVKLNLVDELAEAIQDKFQIVSESRYGIVRIFKSPIIEESDIEAIKKFAENWIEERSKKTLGDFITELVEIGFKHGFDQKVCIDNQEKREYEEINSVEFHKFLNSTCISISARKKGE